MAPERKSLTGADGPSREEVQQRINSLYDQAEDATGFLNGTRAMNTGSRGRVNPAPETVRRRADPALDDVTKPWFDVARSRLGPTVPARLPADRMPNRPAAARSGGPAKRPEDGLAGRGRELAGRPVPELTAGPAAGPVAELTAGPVAELTARAVASLPAAPEPPQEAATALLPAPAAEPGQSALKTSKEQIQRKLALAREVMSRYAAQRNALPVAIESRPAEDAWHTSEEQARRQAAEEWQRRQSAALGADMSLGTGLPLAADMSLGTGMPLAADMFIGAGMPLDAGMPVGGTAVSTDAFNTVSPVATVSPVTASESGYGGKAAKALAFARAQIGKPCVWGATGPDSYDSASLIQAAWRAAGVALPRTVHGQTTGGTAIPLTDIQFGDLIFFYDNVSHVGLYTGNGMMIHAPSPGASIREESIFYAGQKAIHSALRPA